MHVHMHRARCTHTIHSPPLICVYVCVSMYGSVLYPINLDQKVSASATALYPLNVGASVDSTDVAICTKLNVKQKC